MGHNKPDRNENLRVRKKAETTGRNRELKTRPNPHDQSKTLHNKNKCLPVCGSETKRPTKYQKGLETRNYQPVAPFPGVNTSIVKKALCNERGRVDVDISAQNYSTINGMHPPKQQIRGHEPVKDCRQNSFLLARPPNLLHCVLPHRHPPRTKSLLLGKYSPPFSDAHP